MDAFIHTLLRCVTHALALILFMGNAHSAPTVTVLHTQPYVYTVNPAGLLNVTYRFKASAPTVTANHVYVHFLDAQGKIVFQDDHLPTTSTQQWYGEVAYKRMVSVPPSLPAGHYRIGVGLVDRATRVRTQLSTSSDPSATEPTYVAPDASARHRYIVGEVYITTKQIVDAPFACNGNDVTLALSQALRSTQSGQILKLPTGQCQYGSVQGVNAMRLDHKSQIEVVGQGAPSTRLIATDSARSGFIVLASEDILLRDFRIEVARAPGNEGRTGHPDATGVYVERSRRVELRQLALVNPLAQGISIFNSATSRATRNFVKHSAADGIHVAGPSSDITFDSNETFDTGDDGLSAIGYSSGAYAGPNTNIVIRDNRVRYRDVRWGSGIAVEGTTQARVLNNYIERSGSAGIRLGSIEGYVELLGVQYPFRTGAVSAIEVAGNELVDVETRTDLNQGAIHVAAMAGDAANVQIRGNLISTASAAGTTTDAVRLIGRVTPAAIHYVKDSDISNNTVRNTTAGVLRDWCVSRSASTTANITQNQNIFGQVVTSTGANAGSTPVVQTRDCTRQLTQ